MHLSWAKRQCAPIAGRNFAARILGKELNSVSEIWSMSPWSMLHYIHFAKTTKSSSTSNNYIDKLVKKSLHPTIILRFSPDRPTIKNTPEVNDFSIFESQSSRFVVSAVFFVKPTSRS